MAQDVNRFRNAIVCEDIREETGNKKSLMGVLGGDIFVPAFPATLRIAVYMEYVPDTDGLHVFDFRLLLDETEIAKGKMQADSKLPMTITLVLPSAFVTVEKEAVFSMRVAARGEPEQPVISKRVSVGLISS